MPPPQRSLVGVCPGESEPCFRTLVHHASDIITILGPDRVIRYESPAIQRVLGYLPDRLVGTDPFLLIYPNEATASDATARRRSPVAG